MRDAACEVWSPLSAAALCLCGLHAPTVARARTLCEQLLGGLLSGELLLGELLLSELPLGMLLRSWIFGQLIATLICCASHMSAGSTGPMGVV